MCFPLVHWWSVVRLYVQLILRASKIKPLSTWLLRHSDDVFLSDFMKVKFNRGCFPVTLTFPEYYFPMECNPTDGKMWMDVGIYGGFSMGNSINNLLKSPTQTCNLISKYVINANCFWFLTQAICQERRVGDFVWKTASLYSPVIISMNSSKSTVPEPSVSISAMIPSRSSLLSLSSKAAKISLKVPVVM